MADILISKFTTQIPRVGATPATPGFAESEGQDPTAPSGTPQVYTPVTIGSPANGLSISGTQVLTIGLASTSATGALSSTDWNTFNNKLNLTSPITGYAVGANTALAATDTILQAFGKVQGQINARISGTIASGQVAFGTGVNTVGGDSGLTWNNTTKVFTAIGQQIFQGSTASDSPTLGTELATTGSGTNWTGSSFATGYTHTIGSTDPLTTSIPAVNATYYQIAYTITGRTTGSITINFGGTSTSGITATGATGPLTTSTANLEIVPTTDFNGTLVLSVRSIGTSIASGTFSNNSGSARLEVRSTNSAANTLLGVNSGRRITTGIQNTFIGNSSGINNTTGSSNAFFGFNSGISNNIGGANSFFGVSAGELNLSGNSNSFFGRSSGQNISSGSSNSFFGVNSGRLISSGSNLTTSNNSLFLGSDTRANADGETNQIVIGHNATGGGSNTITLGNTSIVSTRIPAGQLWINTTSGTNTLDVNGTARIRTINNLGSAATSVLVPSATGVLSLRTLAELASDGLGSKWTDVTGGIFRNGAVAVGRTTIPTNATFAIQSLTATASHQFFQLLNNAGTVLGSMSQDGSFGVNTSPITNVAGVFRAFTDTTGTTALRALNSSSSTIWEVTGASIRGNVPASFGNFSPEAGVSFSIRPLSFNIAMRVFNADSTVRVMDLMGDTGNIQSRGGAFFGSANTGTAPTARLDVRGAGTTTGLTMLLEDSAGTNNAEFVDNGQIRFLRLPTSSAGLAAGSLWNDGGTLKIV